MCTLYIKNTVGNRDEGNMKYMRRSHFVTDISLIGTKKVFFSWKVKEVEDFLSSI